ncbi:MAG: carbohydrate ABC transporter permease [Rhodospirillales bacterium]|nr:carbohydrate ABC transporter permease [Rhodospirillales bacterium]
MSKAKRTQPGLVSRVFVHLMVYLTALTMLLPFVWMVLTSLKTASQANEPLHLGNLLPASPQWSNYAEAVRSANLADFYVMSFSVAIITTVLAVAHNALAGYAFAKMRFAGKRILFLTTIATMMLPVQCFFIFAYVICDRIGYIDNLQALVVPFLASGFGVFYMRQAIMDVPDSLIEAARIDGLSDGQTFWLIVRPIVWPGISALAVFTFMNSWNAFFWPLIVIDSLENKTLPLAIADLAAGQYVQSWPVRMAAATILTAPLIVVFFFAQRAFIRGVAMTGIKE